MIYENKRLLLGIIILDDYLEGWESAKKCLLDAFSVIYNKKITQYIYFMPETIQNSELYPWADADDYLSKNKDKADLIMIDVNWFKGRGNVAGVYLASQVADYSDIAKVIYTGESVEEVEAALNNEIRSLNKRGLRFFRSIRKPDDWNHENFCQLVNYTMPVFKKKRAEFIKKECPPHKIIELLRKSKISKNDKIEIYGEDVYLKDIFSECQNHDEYKEELSRCFEAQNRFVIMRNLYYNIDAVYKPTHLDETPHQKKLTKLFLKNEILEKFLFPSQKKYFEDFQKYLKDEPEDNLVLEFFSTLEEKINKCLSVCSSAASDVQKQRIVVDTIAELERLGRRFRIQTRVDDLKKLGCLFEGIQTEKLNSKIINNLFCFWGDVNEGGINAHLLNLRASIPPITETIENGGIKEELEIIWNALDSENRKVQATDRDFDAWIEIKGGLARSKIRQYDEGGFDLENKSLKKCIDEGTSFRKLKKLIPAYFTPFVIESNGKNHGWHSVSVSRVEEVKEISLEEFKKNTDGFTESLVEKGIFGVRFLLKYSRILSKNE